MNESQRTTQVMKISDVRRCLSRLVNEVSRQESRILTEKAGVPAAALVSAADLERLASMEREREDRFAVIDQMREAFKDVPPEEIERNVVALVREIREADDEAIEAEE